MAYYFFVYSKVPAIPLQISPSLAILNLVIDDIPLYLRMVVTHILLATRLVLMRHWKFPIHPQVLEVLEVVKLHCTYKTMFALTNV